MSIEAMKQALDALEGWAGHGKWIYPESALEQAMKNTSEALPVLRAAIQQAEEPRYKLSCGCPSQYGGIPAERAGYYCGATRIVSMEVRLRRRRCRHTRKGSK